MMHEPNEDLLEHLSEVMAIGRRALARAEERFIEKNWDACIAEIGLSASSIEQFGDLLEDHLKALDSRERKVVPME
jgi:hypothetical protein